MKINEYAAKWGRDRDNNFAAACYSGNSPDELRAARSEQPDAVDCRTWGISPEEWRNAIEAALADLTDRES